MRIDFRGDRDALAAKYKKGTRLSGREMYCTGVLSIDDARFGWLTATIGYKGFWESPPVDVVSLAAGAEDKLWPFQSGSVTYIMSGTKAGKATVLNPQNQVDGLPQPFRIRQYLQNAQITRSGVSIGTAGTPHVPPPKPNDGRPAFLGTPPQSIADPLLSTVIGWARASYSVTGEETLGTVVFRKWSDSWEWRDRESE